MSKFSIFKVVQSLPEVRHANSIYIVRAGTGFDLYVTDITGQVTHTLNNRDINIEVSVDEGNIVEVRPDGLFATINSPADTSDFELSFLDALSTTQEE